MRWVAPTEKDTANETLEKRLWAAVGQLHANFVFGFKARSYIMISYFLPTRSAAGPGWGYHFYGDELSTEPPDHAHSRVLRRPRHLPGCAIGARISANIATPPDLARALAQGENA